MSLLTNGVAALLVLLGLFLPNGPREIVLNVGLFALSGAFTNWIAITMLFEKIPGLYGSGVIPNRFQDFKAGIRGLIMGQFFTAENVERLLSAEAESGIRVDPDLLEQAIPYDRAFDRIVTVVLESKVGGMLGMFGGARALEGMRPDVERAIKGVVREVVETERFQKGLAGALKVGSKSISEDIVTKVDQIVQSRLDELTPGEVKRIIQEMIHKHLGWLVVWGGVFGGLIGLVCGLLA
ncbi:MAG TPA: DUF445 domain-containing protein [Planctomycetota bacterium]|jgi:uncharacterized membrane protein YheB (UPF0754 family)|nr:DUF445 domain-containing protein [Planctomycetota bacterium]